MSIGPGEKRELTEEEIFQDDDYIDLISDPDCYIEEPEDDDKVVVDEDVIALLEKYGY